MKTLLSSVFIAMFTVAAPQAEADPIAANAVVVVPSKGKFPTKCPDVVKGESGVCILASIVPPVTKGGFDIYTPNGDYVDDAYTNSVRSLPPGDYVVYNVLDQEHSVAFTVLPGKVTNIKTGSVVNILRYVIDFQSEHDSTKPTASGAPQCVDNSFNSIGSFETYTLLPGNYVIDADRPESENCTENEIEVSVSAGKVLRVKAGQ